MGLCVFLWAEIHVDSAGVSQRRTTLFQISPYKPEICSQNSVEEDKPDPEPSVCDEETVTVPLLFLTPKVCGQSLKSVLILQHADRIMNKQSH